MRSLFVLILVLAWIPAIFMSPYLGILAWMWISYMNPHRLSDGIAYTAPVAEIIAIATLLAWLFSREPKHLPMRPIVVLLIIYTGYTTLTTLTAVYQEMAWSKWELFVKVILFTVIAVPLVSNRIRLHAMIWTIVISCGYFAIRGGLFTAATGGAYHVWGPPDTLHGDNNGIAMTFLMILPMFRYLQMQNENRFTWICFLGAEILTLLAIFGTQSRGALVGLVAMTMYLLVRSRRFGTIVAIVAVAISAWFLMPDSMKARQATILSADRDESAQGRITMWHFAIDVANERPLTGGGFNIFYDPGTRLRLLPHDPDGEQAQGRAAHSVYFEVLGEHGYVGLLLYLLLGFWGFFTAEGITRKVRRRRDLKWAGDLGRMMQFSMIGFAVSGAFLSKATFDLYYHVLAIIAITEILVTKALKEQAPDVIPPGDPILSYIFKPRARSYKPRFRPGGAAAPETLALNAAESNGQRSA